MDILNIQRAVISTILYDNTFMSNTCLDKEHFYINSHQDIFATMQELYKEKLPIDENFITKKLGDKYNQEILDIYSTTPLANIEQYEKEIIEASKKRVIETKINDIKSTISQKASDEILFDIENIFLKDDKLSKSLNRFDIKSSEDIQACQPQFYLEDIVPLQKKEITLITAKGGTGKSFTALYLLLRLAKTGIRCFGYFSEDSLGVTKNRIDYLRQIHTNLKSNIDLLGKESVLHPFIKRDINGNLEASSFFYQFKKAMKHYEAIVIDPLIALICNDENSNSEARFLMNLLNQWCEQDSKTLILIHHHNKGENSTSRGATAFIDAVRLHYMIIKKDDNESDRFLKLEKTNHYRGKDEFKIELFAKKEQEYIIESFDDLPIKEWDDREDMSKYWDKKDISDEW